MLLNKQITLDIYLSMFESDNNGDKHQLKRK